MMGRIRVAVVVPSRAIGGAEQWIRDVVGRLDPARFHTTLVLPPDLQLARHVDPEGALDRITVPLREPGPGADSAFGARASKGEARLLRAAQTVARRGFLSWNRRALRSALNPGAFDVVHVNNGGYPGASGALAAVLTAHAHAIPSLMTVHSVPRPYSIGRAIERRVDARVAGAVSLVATPSMAAQRALGDRGFRDVTVVPTGIVVPDAIPDAASTRRRLGVPSSARVVAMVARFSPPKDHATLVEAVQVVRRGAPDVVAVLAGDGPLRDAVRAQADSLGLADAIVLPGQDDAFAVFRAADAAVLASRHEGMPLTVIEAMSQGRAVVASDVGGMAEVVEDGVTGFLTPPGDPAAVAARLVDLLTDADNANAMGAAAYARYVSDHRIETMVARYEEILTRLARHQ
ncbi:MAG: glycosyltransferase [Acidimicrobiia bacterium]|nr:glycosyltransferase [Acidimicrobiia bacterium]